MRVAVLCKKPGARLPEGVLARKYEPNPDKTTALEECAREAGAVVLAMRRMEEKDGFVRVTTGITEGWLPKENFQSVPKVKEEN